MRDGPHLPLAAVLWLSRTCRPTSVTTPRSIARGCRSGPRAHPRRRADRPAVIVAVTGAVRLPRAAPSRRALVAAGHEVRTLAAASDRRRRRHRCPRLHHGSGGRARGPSRAPRASCTSPRRCRWPATRPSSAPSTSRARGLLLDEARRAGASRFVQVSSPSVAHAGVALAGVGAEPASPAHARGEYARTKAEAELLALERRLGRAAGRRGPAPPRVGARRHAARRTHRRPRASRATAAPGRRDARSSTRPTSTTPRPASSPPCIGRTRRTAAPS